MKIKKSFLYFLLLFPFFKSDMVAELNNLHWLDQLYDVWKVFAAIIVTYLWIRNKKIDIKLIILSIFIIETIISTIMNNNLRNIFPYVSVQLSVITIGILVGLAKNNNDIKYFMQAAYILLAAYCIANLISVIIYAPVGAMYVPDSTGIITKNRYFLGSKNYQVLFIFPFIGISSIYDIYCFKCIRKMTLILQVLSIIPLFLTEAVTAILGVIIYYLLYYIQNKIPKIARYFNPLTIILLNFAAFVFLIVLNGQKYFSNFFMILFRKNLQSQRAYIWQKYLYVLPPKILMGYGHISYTERRINIGVVHAHNQYLDIIYQSGLIGIVIFVLFIGYSLKQLKGNRLKHIIISSIMVWLIMFQSEYYYNNPGFYIFVFLCFDWNELEERWKE